MKKTLLTITALTMAALASYAQSTKPDSVKSKKPIRIYDENRLKPLAGDFSTELNFNPFKGNLSLNNSLNQIKFRYFSSPTFAWRFGVNANVKDSVTEEKSPYGTNNTKYEEKRKSLTLGINIGFEKHFKGTKRLSPYWGLDLSLSDRSSSHEITDGAVVTKYKNIWVDELAVPSYIYRALIEQSPSSTVPSYVINTYSLNAEPGYTSIGLNAVTGFDFYMAKNFFFGYEFNFGFKTTKYKDIDRTVTGQTSTSQNTNQDLDTKNNNFSIGSSLMNGIRIGYIF